MRFFNFVHVHIYVDVIATENRVTTGEKRKVSSLSSLNKKPTKLKRSTSISNNESEPGLMFKYFCCVFTK